MTEEQETAIFRRINTLNGKRIALVALQEEISRRIKEIDADIIEDAEEVDLCVPKGQTIDQWPAWMNREIFGA